MMIEPTESHIGLWVAMLRPTQAAAIATPMTAALSSRSTAAAIGSDDSRRYFSSGTPPASFLIADMAIRRAPPSMTKAKMNTPMRIGSSAAVNGSWG